MTAWDARSAELLTKLACVSAVAAGLALVPAVASSDIFVIPLPGVAGLYGVGPAPAAGQRSTTFHLPGTPGVIRGASFHAVGTTVVGTLICDDGPTPTQSPYPASLTGEMLDGTKIEGQAPLKVRPADERHHGDHDGDDHDKDDHDRGDGKGRR